MLLNVKFNSYGWSFFFQLILIKPVFCCRSMLTWNRCQPAALVFLGKRQLLCAVMPPLLVMKFYLKRERDGTSMELPQNRHTPTQVELNPSLESKTVECKMQESFIVTKHFNSFNLKKEIWLDHSWQDCKVTLVYFILFFFLLNVMSAVAAVLAPPFLWIFVDYFGARLL